MVKELDKAGFPTAHLVNMVPVAKDVGSNRIIETVSIPYPLGNPNVSKEDEYLIREKLVRKALDTLTDDIKEQTIYD